MKTVTPEVKHGIVNRMTGSLFNYQAWPTVAGDENGTLYAVASGFRVRHVCPFGKTVMYISRDGGNTWTVPMVINDTYMDDRDAGILYLGNGKLLLSWFTRTAREYKIPKYEKMMRDAHPAAVGAVYGMLDGYEHLPKGAEETASYVRLSEDYGVTWSEPVRLPISAPHGPCVCKDGSLVYLGTEHNAHGQLPAGSHAVYTSRDQGKNWEFTGMFPHPKRIKPECEFSEPHVIQLSDGSLLGAIRIDGDGPFTVATAISADGGKTWTEPQPTGICGAPPHLMRHSSGALILSYGRREKPYGQRAAVSYDDGKTWETEYVLDTCEHSADLGYASTAELPDGGLITLYYQKLPGDEQCSVLYTKWNLEDRKC